MTEDIFTVADQAFLAEHGITDAPRGPLAGHWTWGDETPRERMLRAAVAGTVTGPDLDNYRRLEEPVLLSGRRLADGEPDALIELMSHGHVAWVSGRLVATASGRELLARWARARHEQAEGGEAA